MLPNDLCLFASKGEQMGRGFWLTQAFRTVLPAASTPESHGKAQRNGLLSANLGVIVFHGSE